MSQEILNKCVIKNTFVGPATSEGVATEKRKVMLNLIRLMEEQANGEVGLIITSLRVWGQKRSGKSMAAWSVFR
ncbi:hypothetical protein JCM12298_20940 [Desulfothermus naphthae]